MLKRYVWILLGSLALLIRFLLSTYPEIIEQYYSQGLFLGIRWFIDNTIARLPFASLYLFVPLFVTFIIVKIIRFFNISMSWQQRLWGSLVGVLSVLGGLLFFFLVLWGYNYGRLSVEKYIGLNSKPLAVEALKTEMEWAATQAIQQRQQFSQLSDSIPLSQLTLSGQALEDSMRNSLIRVLQHYQYPTPSQVRGRLVVPKGLFLHFSSSGLYFPFTGEGHIDSGLTPLLQPYVMAHEMSHGYGFGDEGTCNFWGLLACLHAESPEIQYVGYLAYYRTVASNYLRYFPEEYQIFRKTLPNALQADLNHINQNLDDYPDFFPKLRYAAYDTYLKAQGITEGMKNYNRVVMMMHAWRGKEL